MQERIGIIQKPLSAMILTNLLFTHSPLLGGVAARILWQQWKRI